MVRPPKRNSLGYFRLCVRADVRRYEGKWWKQAGFWATFAYRIRRLRKFGPAYCKLLLPLDLLLAVFRTIVAQCELPAAARIGPGLFLPHPNGVIFSDRCSIGCEVAVFQQVTLGCWRNLSPTVRSRVAICAGAKVIGGIVLGRSSCVGANAVVARSVPANYVAVGVPASVRPIRNDAAPLASADVPRLADHEEAVTGNDYERDDSMVFRLPVRDDRNRAP